MKILFVFLLVLPSAIEAQKNYPALIEKALKAQVAVNEFNGAVLVAQHGKIVYEHAFGLANRELNVSNTTQTKFQIGSITKQFTAAAILTLAEAGKLTLEDKLTKYFPDFPKGDSVTIHMLLNHTSGIKSYTNMPGFIKILTLPYEKDSVISFIKNEPYEFSPGKQFNYNNSGYFLLGYIVEKVSGQPYSNYIMKNIIQKADLKSTMVNRWDSVLVNRAEGYSRTGIGWVNAPYLALEFPYSAGAIISTVEDLYKWDNALFGGKIISNSMLNKMITPYMNRYGYGLGIDSPFNHKRISHDGGIPGFVSSKAFFPADQIDITVLSNNESNSGGIAYIISAILFDQEVIPAYKPREIKIDRKILERYVGKYQGTTHILELVIKDGKMFRIHPVSPEVELKPESDHKFFYADGSDRQINFILNKDQRILKAQVIESGVVSDLPKLK